MESVWKLIIYKVLFQFEVSEPTVEEDERECVHPISSEVRISLLCAFSFLWYYVISKKKIKN